MKIALLATAAAAIALSSGAAAVVSSSAAFADTVNTSVRHPFGTKVHRTDRVRAYQARRAYIREHTYVPVYTPPPAVRNASAHLADVRDQVYADGRVTLFEKIKLKAAENRYNATVRAYR
jgi:predicted TIM-barrel enzyme